MAIFVLTSEKVRHRKCQFEHLDCTATNSLIERKSKAGGRIEIVLQYTFPESFDEFLMFKNDCNTSENICTVLFIVLRLYCLYYLWLISHPTVILSKFWIHRI